MIDSKNVSYRKRDQKWDGEWVGWVSWIKVVKTYKPP